MNNVRKQQLSTELKNSILSYINSMNFMYGEKFIDTSDLEEKTIFLRKMYEQYKDVDPDMRKIISLYIKTAEVIAEKTLAIHMAESKNNSLFMFLEKKMDEEKISDAQRSMIYKNFLYILTLFKSEWGLDKKIDAPMYVSKYPNLKSTAELTTFPTIWHKVKLALERSTNNTINFRNAIIDEIKLNDEGEKKNCETSRNNFLNLQSNVIVKLSEYERFITGRQNQPITDNNLDIIAKQLKIQK